MKSFLRPLRFVVSKPIHINLNRYLQIGVMVERPAMIRELAGLIPGRVIPKTLNMIVMAALLGAQCCGLSITTD